MKSISSGIVTFLFTDIEGSTRLAQKYPEGFQNALKIHNKIMNDAIELNNGFVFEIIGDAYCTSFDNVNDALNAAYTAQKNLLNYKWDEIKIKVRIGIHTGESYRISDDYSNYITLARVNRIMSAANGGQIILSESSYKNYSESAGNKFSFRDLGKRKLKDLIKPEHIYQLMSEDLLKDFPPLKTLDARPNNLPIQLTSFIGREKEIAEIKKLFSENRLITILGTGGSGKTRLTLQIGADLIDEYNNGVWFIELAQLKDASKIIHEIMSAFRLSARESMNEEETLLNYLKNKQLLLILDNCEHLIEGCSKIADTLLGNCPKLKIFASSRESLKVYGERTYLLPSLSIPEKDKNYTKETLSRFDSVKLFIERAQMIDTDFFVTNDNAPALAQLCYNLEGIPLAIELAAARTKILSVEKILDRLSDRFRMLRGGSRTSLPRQQTLRGLIDWSYDLLKEDEKILFGRLSVFTGGWDNKSAEEICSDSKLEKVVIPDLLQSLSDKSLVTELEINSGKRFTMLESIREYAREKFENREEFELKHYNYFLKLTIYDEIIEDNLAHVKWLNKFHDELDNVRSAIDTGIINKYKDLSKIAAGFGEYCSLKGSFSEGQNVCSKILMMNEFDDINVRADLLLMSAEMLNGKGNLKEAAEIVKEALNSYRDLNNKAGIANSLNLLGKIYLMTQELDNSIKCHEEALEIGKEIDSKKITARSMFDLSIPISNKKDIELFNKGFEYREDALRLFRETGDLHNAANVLASMGIFAFHTKKYEESLKFTEESYKIIKLFDNHYYETHCHVVMGCAYLGMKDYDKSEHHFNGAKMMSEEYGYLLNFIPVYYFLGEVARNKENYIEALSNYKNSLKAGLTAGSNFYAIKNFLGISDCLLHLKSYTESLRLIINIEYFIREMKMHLENDLIERKNEIKKLAKSSIDEKEFNDKQAGSGNITINEAINLAISIVINLQNKN